MLEQYNNMYKYWSFIPENTDQSRLAEKISGIGAKALLSQSGGSTGRFRCKSEPIQRVDGCCSYSSIVDSTIVVKESELKDLYNKKKNSSNNIRKLNIKYIDVQVTTSAEDRAAIRKEGRSY